MLMIYYYIKEATCRLTYDPIFVKHDKENVIYEKMEKS